MNTVAKVLLHNTPDSQTSQLQIGHWSLVYGSLKAEIWRAQALGDIWAVLSPEAHFRLMPLALCIWEGTMSAISLRWKQHTSTNVSQNTNFVAVGPTAGVCFMCWWLWSLSVIGIVPRHELGHACNVHISDYGVCLDSLIRFLRHMVLILIYRNLSKIYPGGPLVHTPRFCQPKTKGVYPKHDRC